MSASRLTWSNLVAAFAIACLLSVTANAQDFSSQTYSASGNQCAAPSSPGVNVCSPTQGETTPSPVNVSAAGTGASGAVNHLELWIDGQKIGNYSGATMNANVSLGNGAHSLTVVEVDSKGAYIKSSPVNFTVGQGSGGGSCAAPSSPGVDVCSPTAGQTVSSPVNVVATGAGASGEVNHLELWIDGNKIGNYPGPSMNTSVTLPAGSHAATVVEVDSQLHYVKSTPVNFTVGQGGGGGSCAAPSSPGAVICAPTAGSTVSSPVQFTGAGKGASGEVKHLELWIDGNKIGNYPGSTINTQVPLPSGQHTATLVEVDSQFHYVKSNPVTFQCSAGGGGGGVTQYLYTANAGDSTLSGFRINSNGTLTAVAGSPFAAEYATNQGSGPSEPFVVSAASGPSLALADYYRSVGYSINSSTGTIQFVSTDHSSAPSNGDLALNPAGSILYRINETACLPVDGCRPSFGIDSDSDGTLTIIQDTAVDSNPNSPSPQYPRYNDRLIVDPTGNFLYLEVLPTYPGTPYHLDVYSLNSDGTVNSYVPNTRDLLGLSQGLAVTANGSHTFLYTSSYSSTSGAVQLTELDNTTGAVLLTADYSVNGSPQQLAVDPSGKYLVVPLPAENAVQVYAINPANGTLTADSLVPAGSSPNAVGFDSTGQFAYVTDGGCWGYGVSTCGAGPGTNTINAFTFNSANGELQLLGSYPTGEDPLSIAVVKF